MSAATITVPMREWTTLTKTVALLAERLGVHGEPQKEWVRIGTIEKMGFTYEQVRSRRNNTNSRKVGKRWEYDKEAFKNMAA